MSKSLYIAAGAEFIAWIEFGVASYERGVSAGRFPQISGFEFEFDPTQ